MNHDNDDVADDTAEARQLTDLLPAGATVAMVMTMVGRTHTSRPVAIADSRDGRLSFLVARDADWVASIAGREALVHVTVANDPSSRYLSLDGTAMVVIDEAEAQRLWSPAARAWFDGPDDPELRVLHFDVSGGRYWDGPGGRIGRAVALMRAAISGDGEELGTHGSVIGHD